MTTTDSGGSGGGKNDNSDGDNSDGTGYSTTLIVLAVVGWVLWLIGK